jgi:hypothetical protein
MGSRATRTRSKRSEAGRRVKHPPDPSSSFSTAKKGRRRPHPHHLPRRPARSCRLAHAARRGGTPPPAPVHRAGRGLEGVTARTGGDCRRSRPGSLGRLGLGTARRAPESVAMSNFPPRRNRTRHQAASRIVENAACDRLAPPSDRHGGSSSRSSIVVTMNRTHVSAASVARRAWRLARPGGYWVRPCPRP